jgi:transcriptional regulator with XRE-family HTH domain
MGERLVKLRGKRKARRVADEMGISRQSLWLYETGRLMPRENIKKLIADYYGVSIPALFYGEGKM